MNHMVAIPTVVAASVLLAGCSHPSSAGFHFTAGEATNTWHSRFIDFEQIAKKYVADHHIDFDIAQSRPSLYIWREGDEAVAQIWFDTGVAKPQLQMSINDKGEVIHSRIFTSHD